MGGLFFGKRAMGNIMAKIGQIAEKKVVIETKILYDNTNETIFGYFYVF